MKNILNILILFLSFTGIGQTMITHPDVVPFEGTWEASFDQNKTFRLILWREGDTIKGHYEIDILDNSGNVIENYKSNYYNNNFPNNEWPAVIYGNSHITNQVSGIINDNTSNIYQNSTDRRGKQGDFKMIIQSSSDSPLTAHWTVEDGHTVVLEDYPENFSIPTNIIMTKVN